MDPEPAPIEPLAPSFVPRFRDEVAFVPVADEGLLYVEQTGTLHQLDAIGAVICRVFDGNTSIELAVEHLADAFDAPRERVEADVVAFAERLGGYGLLAGIEVVDDAADDGDTGAPTDDAGPADSTAAPADAASPEDGSAAAADAAASPEDGDPSASTSPDA